MPFSSADPDAVVDADVVCFLDADDRWRPGYLDKLGTRDRTRAVLKAITLRII